MSIEIYSNEQAKQLIKSLVLKNREPHSIVITGERGQGKKTLAKYISATLLCESGLGEPCGKCKSCRMLENGAHPDFITVQSNENGNYQVDVIRSIVSDAVVKPNENSFKVYLIPDMDRSVNTSVAVQNILLKLIEEPPAHCIVILTASTKEFFLETVISRVLCLNTVPCNDEQVREFLLDRCEESELSEAVRFACGNIGRGIEFLEDASVRVAMDIAKSCAEAIALQNEYDFLRAVFMADGKKQLFRRVLELLAEAFRDACVLRLGIEKTLGCMPEHSRMLAERYSVAECESIYQRCQDYVSRVDANANSALTMNSLVSGFFR